MNTSDPRSTSATYQGTTVIIRPRVSASPKPFETVGAAESAATFRVFLSSTIKDLADYRKEAKQALDFARIDCSTSERWVSTYASTLQTCRDEVRSASAYIGIFAYWYGSILDGCDQSITHLEFLWALEKWQAKDYPPIAVLMPASPSSIEAELQKRAAALIPGDEEKEHAERLDKFRREVTQTGRTVKWFKTKRELRDSIIYLGAQWNIGGPLDAARGIVEVIEKNAGARKVTEEEWGLLGRQPQLDVFDKILNRLPLVPQVPAVAIMVHGNEDAGQQLFLKQLLVNKKLRRGRPARFGRPQVEQYGLKALMQWVGESLGVVVPGVETGSPAELADLIHAELQDQQLCFVLNHVHRLTGGIEAFYRDFWRPLYARLGELWEGKSSTHRLIAVVLDYADQTELAETIAVEWKPAITVADYARLLKLPVLGEINADDLTAWFSDLEIPEITMGNRLALVNVALNTAKGQVDGTPLRVFDRLSQIELWPEGEG